MNIKNEVLIRMYIVLALVAVLGVLIFGKAVKTSYFEGEKWRAKGDSLYVQNKEIDAERGNILAQDGSFLATSLPFFEIWMDPNSTGMDSVKFYENLDSLAYCLATYVDNSYTVGGMRERLLQKRESKTRNFLIKRNVSYSELKKIKKFPLFNLGKYKGGLIVKQHSKRDRPYGIFAHRTIGYTRDKENPVGLEGYYNKTLGGEKGLQLMQKVSEGDWIPVNDYTEIEPETGNDILTTIDIDLQNITQEALLRALRHHKAEQGCAILMEVETGAIRAISNLTKRQDLDRYWETYNHAVGSATEPGSTFKLPVIMALMEDGYATLEDSIDIEKGRTTFYEEEMLDASYHQIEKTTVKQIFEMSSNVGIAKMVHNFYGSKKKGGQFISKLKDFNLHLPTNIEINGEAAPYIKEAYSKKDKWSGTTLPWMAIGYEVEITPLQLLAFYNAVANNGVMMKPQLVTEIQHFGETREVFKPVVVNSKIASPKTIQAAKELLLGVVEDGTAHRLKTSAYKFAGKTGTAQIGYRRFKPKANIKYQASFAGYFPADNPIYSCIVVITDPKENGIYGGEVAGPVFREIADKSMFAKIELQRPVNIFPKPELVAKELPQFDVGNKRDYQIIMEEMDLPYTMNTNKNWTVLQPMSDTIRMYSRTMKRDDVPNVVGMSIKDALYLLENRGLVVIVNGVGKVVRQSIKPGTKVQGQTIKLTLN